MAVHISAVERNNFEGRGKGRPIAKYRNILRSSVQKTAEQIEMPFGSWARMGPRNHALDVVQIHPRGETILREEGDPF